MSTNNDTSRSDRSKPTRHPQPKGYTVPVQISSTQGPKRAQNQMGALSQGNAVSGESMRHRAVRQTQSEQPSNQVINVLISDEILNYIRSVSKSVPNMDPTSD